MFILQLNDMRGRPELLTPIARAEVVDDLVAIMDREKVEPYSDPTKPGGAWTKHFRNGGPLEWFNLPKGEVHDNDAPYVINIGTEDEWAEMARHDYRDRVMGLPEAKAVGTFSETVVIGG